MGRMSPRVTEPQDSGDIHVARNTCKFRWPPATRERAVGQVMEAAPPHRRALWLLAQARVSEETGLKWLLPPGAPALKNPPTPGRSPG